jgi:hypothetical protein
MPSSSLTYWHKNGFCRTRVIVSNNTNSKTRSGSNNEWTRFNRPAWSVPKQCQFTIDHRSHVRNEKATSRSLFPARSEHCLVVRHRTNTMTFVSTPSTHPGSIAVALSLMLAPKSKMACRGSTEIHSSLTSVTKWRWVNSLRIRPL